MTASAYMPTCCYHLSLWQKYSLFFIWWLEFECRTHRWLAFFVWDFCSSKIISNRVLLHNVKFAFDITWNDFSAECLHWVQFALIQHYIWQGCYVPRESDTKSLEKSRTQLQIEPKTSWLLYVRHWYHLLVSLFLL